jgi:hypothetical protein
MTLLESVQFRQTGWQHAMLLIGLRQAAAGCWRRPGSSASSSGTPGAVTVEGEQAAWSGGHHPGGSEGPRHPRAVAWHHASSGGLLYLSTVLVDHGMPTLVQYKYCPRRS